MPRGQRVLLLICLLALTSLEPNAPHAQIRARQPPASQPVLAIPRTVTTAYLPALRKNSIQTKIVILMISDGWGYDHIDAASYYTWGQSARQAYHQFPVQYAMSTYMAGGSYDAAQAWGDFSYAKIGATDSAAAATAMSTGGKTYSGAIGVDLDRVALRHAAETAEALGRATGVVSSVQLSHATPAAFVAHIRDRNSYAEIANEMIYTSTLDLIMGAGHPCFDTDGKENGCSNSYKYVGGEQTWADLNDDDGSLGADADGDGTQDAWTLIQTRSEFQALASGPTPDRVIGIPQAYQTLQQGRTGGNGLEAPFEEPLNDGPPTLEEMTKAALNILGNDPDGFFLMVEGGAIDWASHANQSGRMIEEQLDFDRSVLAVVEWVRATSNWSDTLLVVTGDHETGYLLGPGSDPIWEPVANRGAGQLPGMEWHSKSHTNSLIPVFAQGDAAVFFHSHADEFDPVRGPYIDNSELAYVLFAAMGSPQQQGAPSD